MQRIWGVPLTGALMGVWSILPHYIFPTLDVEPRLVIADHVIPGCLVVAASLAALALGQRSEIVMLVAGLTVALAGLWMASTHLPLVAQAGSEDVGVAETLNHSAPGVAVLVFGLVWARRHWTEVFAPPT